MRRFRILDAARKLFLVNGLRGTSMEEIAREAGIAKPTLYKEFPDKQAIFSAVTERFFDELRQTSEMGFNAPGSATDRIAAALSAKHKQVFRLLEGSPHAAELTSNPAGRGASLELLDRWLIGRMAELLAEEGRGDAQQLAHLIFAAASGVAAHASRVEEIGPAIRLLVERLASPR